MALRAACSGIQIQECGKTHTHRTGDGHEHMVAKCANRRGATSLRRVCARPRGQAVGARVEIAHTATKRARAKAPSPPENATSDARRWGWGREGVRRGFRLASEWGGRWRTRWRSRGRDGLGRVYPFPTVLFSSFYCSQFPLFGGLRGRRSESPARTEHVGLGRMWLLRKARRGHGPSGRM